VSSGKEESDRLVDVEVVWQTIDVEGGENADTWHFGVVDSNVVATTINWKWSHIF
jgi:hypothetical protein